MFLTRKTITQRGVTGPEDGARNQPERGGADAGQARAVSALACDNYSCHVRT
jgi:hypothetical protein